MTLQVFYLSWKKNKVFQIEDCIASCEIIINGDKKVKKDSIKGERFTFEDNTRCPRPEFTQRNGHNSEREHF